MDNVSEGDNVSVSVLASDTEQREGVHDGGGGGHGDGQQGGRGETVRPGDLKNTRS